MGYGQDAIEMRGHAIEVRINAEDTTAGFVPSIGTVKNLRMPGGAGVRIDSCLYRGMEVGLAYDPMLAKVIVHAHDRPTAIRRMRRVLEELNVSGVRISAPAALAVLEEVAFQEGDFDTHFLEALDLSKPRGSEERLAARGRPGILRAVAAGAAAAPAPPARRRTAARVARCVAASVLCSRCCSATAERWAGRPASIGAHGGMRTGGGLHLSRRACLAARCRLPDPMCGLSGGWAPPIDLRYCGDWRCAWRCAA